MYLMRVRLMSTVISERKKKTVAAEKVETPVAGWTIADMSGACPDYGRPAPIVFGLTVLADGHERDRWLAAVEETDTRLEGAFRRTREGNVDLVAARRADVSCANAEVLLAEFEGKGSRAAAEIVRLIQLGEDESSADKELTSAQESARLQRQRVTVLRDLAGQQREKAKASVEAGAEDLRKSLREAAIARAAAADAELLAAAAPYLVRCLSIRRELAELNQPVGFGHGNSKFGRFATLEG
jgi:hypothetical protein